MPFFAPTQRAVAFEKATQNNRRVYANIVRDKSQLLQKKKGHGNCRDLVYFTYCLNYSYRCTAFHMDSQCICFPFSFPFGYKGKCQQQ
jgi:hypothetical protein